MKGEITGSAERLVKAIESFETFERGVERGEGIARGSGDFRASGDVKDGIEFSEKELKTMPRKISKLLRIGKIRAHVRVKTNGVYEVRMQTDGKRYSGSGKTLEAAKESFLRALKDTEQEPRKKAKDIRADEYFARWLETVRKPRMKPQSYRQIADTCRRHILPFLKGKRMDGITALGVQELLNRMEEDGKAATAGTVYIYLKSFLAFAVSDGILDRNPMAKLSPPVKEVKHGSALSREEERKLCEGLTDTRDQALVFLLYTGIRVGELASAEIDGEFVRVVSEKTRKGKESVRRIPISPRLRLFLPRIDLAAAKEESYHRLSYRMRVKLGRHVHELRHTFITRAQECGIPREMVSVWAGHAPDRTITSTVYTHLDGDDAVQIREMSKFDYVL